MARDAIPSWFFALVVVRRGREFLLVQERKHGQLWYLPAGRVEPGETFAAAARRETLEEAGIEIDLQGILRIEHTPIPGGEARVRMVFVAAPLDDTAPKVYADRHSLQAAWVGIDDLAGLPLRGSEVRAMLEHVDRGATVMPLGMLTYEGAPFDLVHPRDLA